MNGYSNRETFVLVSYLLNDQGLVETVVDDLFHTGADFDSINSVAYELEHWFTMVYFRPEWWLEETGNPMTIDVLKMALEVGSLWRVDWREVAPCVIDYAQYYLGDELVSDEAVGLA